MSKNIKNNILKYFFAYFILWKFKELEVMEKDTLILVIKLN